MAPRKALEAILALLLVAGIMGLLAAIGLESGPGAIAAAAVLLLAIAGFLITGALQTGRDRAAQEAEGDFLERHGFAPTRSFDVEQLLAAPLPLFEKGRDAAKGGFNSRGSHHVGDVWIGRFRDWQVALLDYSITTSHYSQNAGWTTHTAPYACAVIEVPAELPPFSVKREWAFSRIADRLGMKDVQLGDDSLDREYQVEARDPEFVRETLRRDVMEELRTMPKDAALAAGGRFVIAWREGKVDAGARAPLVEVAATVAASIPRTALD